MTRIDAGAIFGDVPRDDSGTLPVLVILDRRFAAACRLAVVHGAPAHWTDCALYSSELVDAYV